MTNDREQDARQEPRKEPERPRREERPWLNDKGESRR